MKKLTLFFMAAFMTLMASAQVRPPVEHYKINGMNLEGMNGKLALTKESLPRLMQGVVCYPYFDRGEVRLEAKVLDNNPNYVMVLLKVEYLETKRAMERYVATYEHDEGIIDAVLAVVEGDVSCLSAPFKYSNCDYRIWDRYATVERTATGFVVTRNYQTVIDFPDSFRQTEEGKWTLPYTVDNNGKMTMQKSLWYSMTITKPRTHLPGEKERITRLESDECKTINTDFTSFITMYCRPLSVGNEPQAIEEAYAIADAMLVRDDNEKMKTTFQNLKNHTTLWLERLMYRDPQQWLEWFHENHGKVHCSTALSDNLDSDADFASWLKQQVKELKNKEMRAWWEYRLK